MAARARLAHWPADYIIESGHRQNECARIALRCVLGLLHTDPADPLPPAEFIGLAGLTLQATRTIARLLGDKRALSHTAADSLTAGLGPHW